MREAKFKMQGVITGSFHSRLIYLNISDTIKYIVIILILRGCDFFYFPHIFEKVFF